MWVNVLPEQGVEYFEKTLHTYFTNSHFYYNRPNKLLHRDVCIMTKYMRRDSEINAVVWNTANLDQIRKFVGTRINIEVLEGDILHVWNNSYRNVQVPPGHYLIRHQKRTSNYEVMGMEEFDEIYEKMYGLILEDSIAD